MNYKLRSKDGLWLWQIPVAQGGVTVQITNWLGVAANADQYEFYPKFIEVEDSAFRIVSLSIAQIFQKIISQRCGIQTDIVECV